jgi:hypothetical protein
MIYEKYKHFNRKPEGKRPLGTYKRRLEDNIKMYLKGIRPGST